MNGRRYVLDKPEDAGNEEPLLSDAIKVSKLKQSQMKMYFNPLRVESRQSGRDEAHNGCRDETFDDKMFKVFLKRYGLKKKKKSAEKPVMKRTPLRTVKTVQVELPLECVAKSEVKRKSSSSYIEITKALSKHNIQKNQSAQEDFNRVKSVVSLSTQADEEHFEFDNSISNEFIEKQLEATKNEITLATTQLEEIKALLAQRKKKLPPVAEEEEPAQVQEKTSTNKGKRPKAEWNLKATPSFARNSRKKLMRTLDTLNQRLQNIQDKYFAEPKMKFRTIDQILAQSNLRPVDPEEANVKTTPRDIKVKSTKTKTDSVQKCFPPESEVQVILSPKFEVFNEMDFGVADPEEIPRRPPQKGILRRNPRCCDGGGVEVAVGAPALEESLFKSQFLMKEFNLQAGEDFDFGDLKLKSEDFGCADFIKKNVRFAQGRNDYRNVTKSDRELQQAIDFALKNSLFYPEM